MSDSIVLVNPTTGKSKSIKIGVSWPVFFFGWFFGIPFFFKRLWVPGWAFVVVSVVVYLPIEDWLALLINVGSIIASAFLAFSANRLEIRDKLETGWIVAQGQQPATAELVKLQLLLSSSQFGAPNVKKRRRRESWATDALVALASAIVVFVLYLGSPVSRMAS